MTTKVKYIVSDHVYKSLDEAKEAAKKLAEETKVAVEVRSISASGVIRLYGVMALEWDLTRKIKDEENADAIVIATEHTLKAKPEDRVYALVDAFGTMYGVCRSAEDAKEEALKYVSSSSASWLSVSVYWIGHGRRHVQIAFSVTDAKVKPTWRCRKK